MAEYADHEVQVLYTSVTVAEDSNEVDEVVQYDPVGPRQLDNDELAELVGFRRNMSVYLINQQSDTQTEIGSGGAEFGFGINLTETEFAEQLGASAGAPGVEFIDGISGSSSGQKNNQTEPGVIDSVSPALVAGGAAPTTDQNISAGGNGQNLSRTQFFPEQLGSGPYVDATDDLTVHIEGFKENLNGRVIVDSTLILYWNVEEMPEGRASFARP